MSKPKIKVTTKTPVTSEKELIRLDKEYRDIDNQIKFLKQLKEVTKSNIISIFEAFWSHQTTEWINPTTGKKLQRIISQKVDFDDIGLKQILTPIQWRKIRKETVDREKFNAAIKTGIILEKDCESALSKKEIDKLVT